MPHHRRIVLGIHLGGSRGTMRRAAEMARLLGVEIHGIFVEDEAAHGLSAYAFAREFRLPAHAWQPIDRTGVADDFRHAARGAKRLLDTVAAATGVRAVFEVVRGDPARAVAQRLCASDIVVLTGPGFGSDGLTRDFPRSWQSACESSASVLLMPPGRLRAHGPVVGLTHGDLGARTAAHIAALAGETLVLLGPTNPALPPPALPPDRLTRRDLPALTEQALRRALGDPRERLLVLDRDLLGPEQDATVLRVAAERMTPVLLVGRPADI